MNKEEKDDLKRAGKLLTIAVELAGDAVALLKATDRMSVASRAQVALVELNNIIQKIRYMLDDLAKREKRGE